MDLYFQRHDGQAVTCDDFLAAMAMPMASTSRSLRAGTHRRHACPRKHGRVRCTGAALYPHAAQSCPPTPGEAQKLPFQIPVALGLVDAQGYDIPLRLEGEEAAFATPDPATGEITRVVTSSERKPGSFSSTWPARRCPRSCADTRRRSSIATITPMPS